jgi:hypothetical protein
MTANQSKDYYDIWALRGYRCDYDCWLMVLMDRDTPRDEAIKKYVSIHQANIPQGDPIPVTSAFGGLAVYRMSLILGSRYIGTQNICGNMVEICDHVRFHEQLLAKGARMFINTRMVNK